MKKKGAIEISMGTIVIIVLAISMLILGMVIVKNIFKETEFSIKEKSCGDELLFTFNHEYLKHNNISLADFMYVIEGNNTVEEASGYSYFYQEVCEYNYHGRSEIWFWHENLTDNIDKTAKVGGYEVILLKELTVEWLNESCELINDQTVVAADQDGTLWNKKYQCQKYQVGVLI